MATLASSQNRPPSPLWYSAFSPSFDGPEPFFFVPGDFPETKIFETHFSEIRDELHAFLNDSSPSLKPYMHPRMSFPPGEWKTSGLLFWGLRLTRNRRRCPKLSALLDSIPHLTTASLSVLEPNTKIHPHFGDTNAIARFHLGIDIPAGEPDCAFQVGHEIRSWHEGELHAFCDAHFHMAWNYTPRRRVILLFDLIRPEYRAQQTDICRHVLASIALLSLQQSLPFQLAPTLRRLLHPIVSAFFFFYLPLQRLSTQSSP